MIPLGDLEAIEVTPSAPGECTVRAVLDPDAEPEGDGAESQGPTITFHVTSLGMRMHFGGGDLDNSFVGQGVEGPIASFDAQHYHGPDPIKVHLNWDDDDGTIQISSDGVVTTDPTPDYLDTTPVYSEDNLSHVLIDLPFVPRYGTFNFTFDNETCKLWQYSYKSVNLDPDGDGIVSFDLSIPGNRLWVQDLATNGVYVEGIKFGGNTLNVWWERHPGVQLFFDYAYFEIIRVHLGDAVAREGDDPWPFSFLKPTGHLALVGRYLSDCRVANLKNPNKYRVYESYPSGTLQSLTFSLPGTVDNRNLTQMCKPTGGIHYYQPPGWPSDFFLGSYTLPELQVSNPDWAKNRLKVLGVAKWLVDRNIGWCGSHSVTPSNFTGTLKLSDIQALRCEAFAEVTTESLGFVGWSRLIYAHPGFPTFPPSPPYDNILSSHDFPAHDQFPFEPNPEWGDASFFAWNSPPALIGYTDFYIDHDITYYPPWTQTMDGLNYPLLPTYYPFNYDQNNFQGLFWNTRYVPEDFVYLPTN